MIKKILREETGASIVIALLMFLVASFVAVTIVSSALVAAKRVTNDKSVTYNQYIINSAAGLFSTCLKESKCVVTQIDTNIEEDGVLTTESTMFYEGSGPFGNLLVNLMKKLDASTPVTDSIITLDIPINLEDNETEIAECIFFIHINPKNIDSTSAYIDMNEMYKMQINIESNDNHLTLIAWLPSVPTPVKTVVTDSYSGITSTVITTVTEYTWSGIDISSNEDK